MKPIFIISILIFIASSCTGLVDSYGAGTLGGLPNFKYSCSRELLITTVDKVIHENPQFHIPDGLKKYDDWDKNGFDFLEYRIVYFEEDKLMMFFSFIKDQSSISVRAVFYEDKLNWIIGKDISQEEGKRINQIFQKRFLSKVSCSFLHDKKNKIN